MHRLHPEAPSLVRSLYMILVSIAVLAVVLAAAAPATGRVVVAAVLSAAALLGGAAWAAHDRALRRRSGQLQAELAEARRAQAD